MEVDSVVVPILFLMLLLLSSQFGRFISVVPLQTSVHK